MQKRQARKTNSQKDSPEDVSSTTPGSALRDGEQSTPTPASPVDEDFTSLDANIDSNLVSIIDQLKSTKSRREKAEREANRLSDLYEQDKRKAISSRDTNQRSKLVTNARKMKQKLDSEISKTRMFASQEHALENLHCQQQNLQETIRYFAVLKELSIPLEELGTIVISDLEIEQNREVVGQNVQILLNRVREIETMTEEIENERRALLLKAVSLQREGKRNNMPMLFARAKMMQSRHRMYDGAILLHYNRISTLRSSLDIRDMAYFESSCRCIVEKFHSFGGPKGIQKHAISEIEEAGLTAIRIRKESITKRVELWVSLQQEGQQLVKEIRIRLAKEERLSLLLKCPEIKTRLTRTEKILNQTLSEECWLMEQLDRVHLEGASQIYELAIPQAIALVANTNNQTTISREEIPDTRRALEGALAIVQTSFDHVQKLLIEMRLRREELQQMSTLKLKKLYYSTLSLHMERSKRLSMYLTVLGTELNALKHKILRVWTLQSIIDFDTYVTNLWNKESSSSPVDKESVRQAVDDAIATKLASLRESMSNRKSMLVSR